MQTSTQPLGWKTLVWATGGRVDATLATNPTPAGAVVILTADDALLFDVAREAIEKGVQIISNGVRFALATSVPPGWHAVPVCIKTR